MRLCSDERGHRPRCCQGTGLYNIDRVENTRNTRCNKPREAVLSPLALGVAIPPPRIRGTILPPRLPPFADLDAKTNKSLGDNILTGFAELVHIVVPTPPAIFPRMDLGYLRGQEQAHRRQLQIP